MGSGERGGFRFRVIVSESHVYLVWWKFIFFLAEVCLRRRDTF